MDTCKTEFVDHIRRVSTCISYNHGIECCITYGTSCRSAVLSDACPGGGGG